MAANPPTPGAQIAIAYDAAELGATVIDQAVLLRRQGVLLQQHVDAVAGLIRETEELKATIALLTPSPDDLPQKGDKTDDT